MRRDIAIDSYCATLLANPIFINKTREVAVSAAIYRKGGIPFDISGLAAIRTLPIKMMAVRLTRSGPGSSALIKLLASHLTNALRQEKVVIKVKIDRRLSVGRSANAVACVSRPSTNYNTTRWDLAVSMLKNQLAAVRQKIDKALGFMSAAKSKI